MSETLDFENVFKSDQELHKKFIEKEDMIKSFKNQENKADKTLERSVCFLVLGIIFSILGICLTSGMLFSSYMNTSNLFNSIFATVTVLLVLLTIVFGRKTSKNNNKLGYIAEEISKIKESINEDASKKARQDLRNLYNAKMSEGNPLINILSDEPKNEVVLENGDTVSAVLKYNSDGLLIMKTFSKIETATPNTDYVKQPKQPYDVIEDLNNIDE